MTEKVVGGGLAMAHMGGGMRVEEVGQKLARIRRFIEDRQFGAVWLRRADNFAWVTAGGDSRVGRAVDCGAASVLVDGEAAYVVASNVEMPRIVDEVLGPLGVAVKFEPLVHGWDRDPAEAVRRAAGGGGAIASDVWADGLCCMPGAIAALRTPLTLGEVARYPEVGRGASAVVERTCREIEPGQSEIAIAADLWRGLMVEGFNPTVVLVGVDDRMIRYRHQPPTAARLDRQCMVVVCAQKWGLTAAMTRTVCFGAEAAAEAEEAHRAASAVCAAMMASCRAGVPYSSVWKAAEEAYVREGFPGQWMEHHQGGPISYGDREFLLAPDCSVGSACSGAGLIQVPTAMAFNPSVPGGKSEDTFLVTEAGRIMITTSSPFWPKLRFCVDGECMERPGILVR